MPNPFEERLRLGYLLGSIRQLTQLDIDAELNSITRPDEVPSRGTRMMYKGELASDVSINRISSALAGQTDFALMDLIRVRPVQRKQISIRHGADTTKMVCWGVNPVMLPTLAADLGSHIGVVDNKDARLSNVTTWADLAPTAVERYNGGILEFVYNAGVFEFDNLTLTTVDTIYPWGVAPTNDVRAILTGVIASKDGDSPDQYTVTLHSGALSGSYEDGLFFSEELGYGCIINSFDGGSQITLRDNWDYAADPSIGSAVTIIGKTHTVPGMIAVLSGGDAANDGNYLITDIDANGALVLNALPAVVSDWSHLQDPLPCQLLTGAGVATGSVRIVTPFVWFTVITFNADVTITAPYNLPLKIAYKAPLSLRDIAQEDTELFEEIVSPTVIDLLNKIGGTPTTGYWDADPVDSLYNIDLRLDAVTLNAAYRNKTKVSSYEGGMTTDSPATGAYITVDGHAVSFKTSAAAIFSHTADPALAFRAHAGAGYRAVDRVTEGTALGTDQVYTLTVGGATNPQLGGGATIQLEIDVLGPTFKLLCSSMTKDTSVIRDGSTDCMPSILYFQMSTGSRWAGMAFAESVVDNHAGGCDITLGFLSTPPADGSAAYDINYLYVCAPAGIDGVAVGTDLGRGLDIFTQRTVPWLQVYDVGFLDVVESVTTMYWVDKNPTDAESLGYRFMGTGARMGRRTLYDSLPMTDIEMGFSLWLTPDVPLQSLLDLSEGYDDATDLTERMTQMIGAPLYRNQDANTIYTGPFAGRRHGRQLVYTSSADVPKTSLLDTGVDTLLFGTAHVKQHEMYGLEIPYGDRGYVMTHGFPATLLTVDDWSADEHRLYALGPGNEQAEQYVHVYAITGVGGTELLGIYNALWLDVGGTFYLSLYRPGVVSAVDWTGMTSITCMFLRGVDMTHALDQDRSRFAQRKVIIPSRNRWAISYAIAGTGATTVQDSPGIDACDWETILGADPGLDDNRFCVWNVTQNKLAEITTTADRLITHVAYLSGANSFGPPPDEIRVITRELTAPAGDVLKLADIGRVGQASYVDVTSDHPTGGIRDDGTPASLQHFEISVPDMYSLTGTATLDPIAAFRSMIFTANVVGTVGLIDATFDLPSTNWSTEAIPVVVLSNGTRAAASSRLSILNFYDEWFLRSRLVIQCDYTIEQIAASGYVLESAEDRPELIEEASVDKSVMYPWGGPGGVKQNVAPTSGTVVRSMRIPVAYPDQTYDDSGAGGRYAAAVSFAQSDAALPADPMSTCLGATITVNSAAFEDGITGIGYRLHGVPDSSLMYRVSGSMQVNPSLAIGAGNMYAFMKIVRPGVPMYGLDYAYGYSDGATVRRIYSSPWVWNFTLDSAANVPEGAGDGECYGKNEVVAALVNEGYCYVKDIPEDAPPGTGYREILPRVRAPRTRMLGGPVTGGYPVLMPKYPILSVSPWVIGANTFQDVKFVRFTVGGGAEVKYAGTDNTVADTTKYFGIRVAPLLRWTVGGGIGTTSEAAADFPYKLYQPAIADQLYVTKSGEPLKMFPILGPGVCSINDGGGFDDYPGLLVYDPKNELATYVTGYGCVPAFHCSDAMLWVGARGVGLTVSATATINISSLSADYMPIAEDQHFLGQHFAIAWEPSLTTIAD